MSIAEKGPRTVTSWRTSGGNPVGDLAFTTDGKLLVAVGAGQAQQGGYANAIVALDPKTLQPTDWFTAPNADFVTTPVVLRVGTRQLVAAATRDGRILVLDAASLGGANHATPLFGSPLARRQLQPRSARHMGGARARDGCSCRTTASRRIASWTRAGALRCNQGWTSRSLAAPTAPIVVNGVVFAARERPPERPGDPLRVRRHDRAGAVEQRPGDDIAVTPNGLWASNSQVHAATADGTVYAFGFPSNGRRDEREAEPGDWAGAASLAFV